MDDLKSLMNVASEYINLKIVIILTIGFTFASILGFISYKIRLSPILGYLFAGYLIGPYSPGFVADINIAEQLAEIGVILMMFGVGLHFQWHELLKVKKIAIPGAFGQTLITTLVVLLIVSQLGWSLEAGVIFGIAIGVASTVVLVRVLIDNQLLKTQEGVISVGWLIVEDVITVFALLLVPSLSALLKGKELSYWELTGSVLYILIKFIVLAMVMFTIGRQCIKYILSKIIKTRSHELFIISILAITFLIATGSTVVFGISIALGAFIAGMIIGQTKVRHEVSANTLPLKDIFIVIFFLSIGMLFNPKALVEDLPLFFYILGIILVIKPLTAYLIVRVLKYSSKTALTVGIALAQIGEFSFIVAEEAMRYQVLPERGYDLIVASALISISINPLLFKIFRLKPQEIV